MHTSRLSIGFVAFVLAGCASAPPAVESAPAPSSNDRAAAISVAGTPTRWQGTLQATQQRTSAVAPTAQNKTTGSVFLSQASDGRTRARVSVSASIPNAPTLRWAIVQGRCGSGALPIATTERFPAIEITASGRGEIDQEMALTLPTSGTFHVNVYYGNGTQLSNVLACANLSKQG